MRVSVIIAAYNAADCIREALASVQAQTERDHEVLVIDDASTDATAAVVAAVAGDDPRVRLLRAPVNAGPGAARNLGLAAARGEWIAPLDADDRFQPQRLEQLLDLGARSSADMVADNLRLCPDGRPGPTAMFPPDWLPAEGCLGAATFVTGNTDRRARGRRAYGYLKPLIRRSFLDAAGLRYDAVRFAEDYLFYLRCLLHGARWIVTPTAWYDYAVARGSATAGHSAEDLARLIALERVLLDLSAALGDATLRAALRRHLRSVELALSWFRFAEALKRRDPRAAGAQMFRNAGTLAHILRQGLATTPRVLARLAAPGQDRR
jgi:GT2 family glycosyltransferase